MKPLVIAFLSLDDDDDDDDDLREIPPGYVLGSWDAIESRANMRHAKNQACTTINVVWGYAGWGRTQIFAEIARGGWGELVYFLVDVFFNLNYLAEVVFF